MPIIRVEKTTNYTVMANYHFREKGLSLKAKGLMSLMLSLPDDWDYSVEGLATLSKDGIDSVRSALRELEKYQYLTMERERDSKGVLHGTIYTLHEKPEKPIVEKPILDKPRLGKPILENPTGFEASRKALHKPLTLRAKELIIKKLEKLAPGNESLQIAILDQSVERGWQGVFPLKQDSQCRGGESGTGIPQFDMAARAMQMMEEQAAKEESRPKTQEELENERYYEEWLKQNPI